MAKRATSKKEVKNNKEDQFVFPIEKLHVSDEIIEQSEYTLSYFRQFPYAFCEKYLNVKLYDYQKLIMYEMMHKYNFIWIACRNLAKTYLSALYICTRCILYAKTKVIVCAPERQQAVETITKIKDIMKNSPMLREEVSDISDTINNARCLFWNGSTVNVATMSEGSRHYRANLILVDEYIGSDANILSSVIEAFMGDPRRPLYLNEDKYNTPEYAYLKERDTAMYCSSAGRKGTWAYDMFEDYFKKMIRGESDYFVCDLPYQTAVSVGLRDLAFYTKQRTSAIMTEEKFKAEYEGVWIQNNADGFFQYEALDNCRSIKKAVYPKELMDFVESKSKNFSNRKKPDGVIRICGGDIATVSGMKRNDASAFGVLQLTPKEKTVKSTIEGKEHTIKIKYYDRELIYLETLEGVLIKDQVLRLKELFYQYDCNMICIDAMTSGISFVQSLGEPTVHPITGEDYAPFMCCNKEEYESMCNYPNAKKVLHCITASAQSNHDMNTNLQASIGQGKLKLLINQNTAKDYLRILKDYDELSYDMKAKLVEPYSQTTLLIDEMVALTKKTRDNGQLVLKETAGNRKDRYSCLLYLSSVADMWESKLKQNDDYDEEDDVDWYFVG